MRSTALLVIALTIAISACAGAASQAPAEASSPTPSPTSTPTPTPEPTPTEIPDPTLTPDDVEINEIIKTTTSDILDRLSVDMESMSLAEIADVFRGVRDFAENARTRISIFRPSECTREAVRLFNDGTQQMEDVSQEFLDWLAGGAVGDPPDNSTAEDAGATMASALASVAGSC